MVRSWLGAAVVAAGLAALLVTSCASDAGPARTAASTFTASASEMASQPLLGRRWSPGQEGYGEVKPQVIFNGGDPTGRLVDVRWQSWGGAQATGDGTGFYVGAAQSVAGGHSAPATVVAFNLGNCDGQWMYQSIEWYFPQFGESFDSAHYIDICTGEYVGGLRS